MLVGARSSENGNPDCHLADLAKNSDIPQLLRNAFRLADWAPLHNRSIHEPGGPSSNLGTSSGNRG
jgi:hypothetical protein